MNEFQSTVLLSAKPRTMMIVMRCLTLVVALFGIFACVFINPALFGLLTFLAILLWWGVWFHSGVEYEYAYFDGDLDFDKIRDKRSRKHLITMNMEDISVIAPVGNPALNNAHNNKNIQFVDLSSRMPNRKFYELVWTKDEKAVCLRFEPDEKFLDSICVKYRSKVIRE